MEEQSKDRMRTQPVVKLLKGILMVFNVVYFIVGLALLVAGAVAKAALFKFLQVENVVYDGGAYVLIGVGVLVMLAAGAAFWCTCRGYNKLLYAYFAFILLVCLLQVIAGSLAVAYQDTIAQSLSETLQVPRAKNAKLSTNTYFDYIQQELQCCGVHNYTDYFGEDEADYIVPSSCCSSSVKGSCNFTSPSEPPATPAPATPAPATPASATPAPATPAPATPAPATPAPATLAPATPAPATPAPATPAPATPAPATPAPATPAPATPASATPAPATPASATPTPATPAPGTNPSSTTPATGNPPARRRRDVPPRVQVFNPLLDDLAQDGQRVYTKGCLDELAEKLQELEGPIIGVAFGFLIFQIIGMIIVFMLARRIRRYTYEQIS